ncbi:uncharacterized protein LOC121601585 [Anopheles merus]|uniref:uncharacterized protein LOC121601585 n=1 Tax=Anopheles merus TaxID=30066 RepID=UPI001BE3DFE0|nr:uncharacterized protein LOC121601585 [Anopheles merus]
MIAHGTPIAAATAVTSVVSSSLHHLNIPMPTFDGTYEQWPKFKAMFLDIVKESSASDAVKLHHLNKALIGKASGVLNASLIADISSWNIPEDYILADPTFNQPGRVDIILGAELFYEFLKERRVSFGLHRPILQESKFGWIVSGNALIEPASDPVVCATALITDNLSMVAAEDNAEMSLSHHPVVSNAVIRHRSDLQSGLRNGVIEIQNDELRVGRAKREGASVADVIYPKSSERAAETSTSDSTAVCLGGSDFGGIISATGEKQAKAQSLHLCYNCLGSGHSSSKCDSKKKCRHCNRRHHTLLHIELNNDMARTENVPSASTQSSQAVATTSQPTRSQFSPQVALTVNGEATSTVLLSTVIINIMDDQGIEHHARALLDSGSQSNFVSGRLAQLLRLPRKLVNIPLSGIGGSSNINVQHAVGATIRSRCSDDTFFVNLLVLPKPTANLPTRPVNISNWNIPAEYILADPTFNQPGSVDIMLGAEMFYELLKERRVSFGKHRPILQESKFGWIVSGTALVEISVEPIVCMTAIDDLMKKFFDIEELNDEPNWSLEERACEDFYRKTTTRNENEKYIVRLPRKSQMSGKLGDSKVIALRRFLVIERRLQRKPETRKAYIEFMDEYQRMGHMCKVPADESTGETFYLPHHRF